jgi:amino acid adenylation domain-containing protein/thioester reductase-like protein/non-ribosomal peptide synthase protein (TIGR01720 family)
MLLNQILLHAAVSPDRAAVVAGAEVLSYSELKERSAGIASVVIDAGLEQGQLVAVFLGRTVDALASILGAMYAGMAYTVVENEGNAEEHAHRLKAIAPALVLTDDAGERLLAGHGFNIAGLPSSQSAVDAKSPLPEVKPDDLAYVLFTSGSTGVPKGVMITHRNVEHYVTAIRERLTIDTPLSYAHVSTLAADLGNTSLMLSLYTGGTLHLIGNHMRKDPGELADYLAHHDIRFLKITPSHWRAVFNAFSTRARGAWKLEHLVLGGEALNPGLAADTLRSGVVQNLVNHYGPTETTVGVMANRMRDADAVQALTSKTVPVGLPLGQTRVLVRSEDGAFHQTGATGELYVGGPSVSPGYLHNPTATKDGFVTNVDGPHRFYKTGDLVNIDENGVVEFLGRIDRQVKVNGYRVELEHVESALRSLSGVEGASAFLVDIYGKTGIAAAIAPYDALTPTLKDRLREIVPHYMVPKWLEAFDVFPRNANGKTNLAELKKAIEQRLMGSTVNSMPQSLPAQSDSVTDMIRAVWQGTLGHGDFSDQDDFFELGGDSLDAIQVIAELQGKGYRVSANAFLRKPTVDALVALVGAEEKKPAAAEHVWTSGAVAEQFSTAQQAFFSKRFAQPDHYNQSILLESDRPLSIDILRKAVGVLREWHPLLRARYWQADGKWAMQASDTRPVVGTSSVDALDEDEAIDTLIRTAAQVYQSTLSLDGGRVFAVHLFTRANGSHQLLLVAHHLSIDVISWRVIVADLTRLYRAIEMAQAIPAKPANTPFPAWVDHLSQHHATWEADVGFWRGLPDKLADVQVSETSALGTEELAETGWLRFSGEETQALSFELPAIFSAPLHHVLIAAFLHVLHDAQHGLPRKTLVEVESHGRISFDDDIDVSRTAGWFTSSYPLVLDSAHADFRRSVVQVHDALSAVPNLGVAYGLLRDELVGEWGGEPVPAVCYNYLGEFNFARDPGLPLKPSRYSTGIARGPENERTHDLKLTARILDGQLLVDLSFNGATRRRDVIENILAQLHDALLKAAGLSGSEAKVVVERGSSSGLLAYAPASLGWIASAPKTTRDYASVLLTGASGYLGIYALHELLTTTQAHVFCLVREKAGVGALQRLQETFKWYFPQAELNAFSTRYTVLSGDLESDNLGLAESDYAKLEREIEAIYHFAADTRLFADESTLKRQNVDGTRRMIELARKGRQKDLHYMSTLAVCGFNPGDDQVTFDEESLDVGQDFLNDYERSKFKAEQLVNAFIAHGGNGYIYRTGNVSGHSQSGRFQRNGGDNRFVQFLRAALKIGERPLNLGENIALSPVDTVVGGIVRLSVDASLTGHTFHVDSPWQIPIVDILAALEAIGAKFTPTRFETFADVFRPHSQTRDRDISLGYFWANREKRAITLKHDRTLSQLERLNHRFDPLSREWLTLFFAGLVSDGTLCVPTEFKEGEILSV